jgi:hypothetical protein
MAATAKEAKYSDHYPCPPVEFCDGVDPSTSWNQPSGEEIHDFELHVATAKQMLRELPTQRTELVPIIFPARLSQAIALSQDVSSEYQIFEAFQRDLIRIGSVIPLRERSRARQAIPAPFTTLGFPGSPIGQPNPHEPRWLDYSPFVVNPYFAGFFADEDRFTTTHGRCDFTLRSGPGQRRILEQRRFPIELTELIGSMFFRQPPCERVMLCVWSRGELGGLRATALPQYILHRKDGITIADMLVALEQEAEDAMLHWRNTVGLQVRNLSDMHWKHDIWYTYGRPKLSVMLCREKHEEDIAQGHYWEQMDDLRSRIHRQSEWMPVEMMKLPKPTSPETDDLLPGIYGIGFRDAVFEDSWKTRWQRIEEYEGTLARIMDNIKEGREYSNGISFAELPASKVIQDFQSWLVGQVSY